MKSPEYQVARSAPGGSGARQHMMVFLMVKPRIIVALCALLLVGLFSPELGNSDFWWQLKTGEYVVQHRALPAPDPFAYPTAGAKDAYRGESEVRHFNLTHEWLSQAILYLIYLAGRFAGIVAWRALALTAICGLSAWIAWRRTGGFYRSVAAGLAVATVAMDFAVDRPFLFSYLFLGLALAILESRRSYWLLPPLMLLWANCHGGFFLGWFAIAAYAIENRRLWLPGAVAIGVSGINPNGFHVIPVLLAYRGSNMQSKLLEWAPAQLWPPRVFGVLVLLAAASLVWARRKARLSDWILLAGFAVMAMTAQRNTILIGISAPVVIATYLPWKKAVPAFAPYAAAGLLLAGVGAGVAYGRFYQFHAAEWRYPAGASDFLRTHQIRARMFNTYEEGGYLMWRLWPQERVFIDGRALSESVFSDYGRILYNHEAAAQPLLDRYGVDVIVLNGFEYINGILYPLAPMLAGAQAGDWKLVYTDAQAMVFLRHPPPNIPPLDSALVMTHLEQECGTHIDREPEYPRCARSLAQAFGRQGDFTRARRWLGIYLDHWHQPDPEAQDAYRMYLNAGK
jgi:hypothetical protein